MKLEIKDIYISTNPDYYENIYGKLYVNSEFRASMEIHDLISLIENIFKEN